MYSGRRQVLIQGAVSSPVTATNGMPPERWETGYGPHANMLVNLKKTVVICNGAKTKQFLMKVWRKGRLPPPRITTRDLGVDTQWAAWSCPVQRKRVMTLRQSLARITASSKARIAKSLYSVGLYGAEVGGMSASHF
eukprot:5131066-Amphidinium_carterae.1